MTRTRVRALIILVLSAILLSGCGGSSSTSTENRPPVISTISPTESAVSTGVNRSITFGVLATDPDGDSLTYSWAVDGGTIDSGAGTREIVWNSPATIGTYEVAVTISDGSSTCSQAWAVTVSNLPNRAPVINSLTKDVETVVSGDTVVFTVDATDADGDALSYEWMATNGTSTPAVGSTFSWTARQLAEGVTIDVMVSDGSLNAAESMQFTVEPILIDQDITSSTTWAGNRVYLVDPLSSYPVTISSDLTIEPGAVIKFADQNYGLTCDVGGSISAVGELMNPIHFTSYKNDAVGGDTNGDGKLTSPAIGDWSAVDSGSSTESFTFDNCYFSYGGYNLTYMTFALSIIDQALVTIQNCYFIYNVGGLNGGAAAEGTVIKNNWFFGNETAPLWVNQGIDLDNSNTFQSWDGSQANGQPGIWVLDYNWPISNRTWAETEVPFVIVNTATVDASGILTLGNNVVLKFQDGQTLYHNDNIVNHDGPGVIFTSIYDDLKGDSNGDGSLTGPNLGDWRGVIPEGQFWPDPDFADWPNIYYDSYALNERG